MSSKATEIWQLVSMAVSSTDMPTEEEGEEEEAAYQGLSKMVK